MKIIRKAVIASLGLLPFFSPMDANADTQPERDETFNSAQELPWRKARFSIEAQTGSRTIGSLEAFVPFMGNDDFMIYANLMARVGTGANNSNGSAFEGNAGLGFRQVNNSETAIYGAYIFYDQLKSVNDNTFSQITVGVERLGLTWDFRANAYLPIGKKEFTKTIYDGGQITIDKHNLIEYVKSQTEKSTTGGDLEIGRTLGSNKLRGYFAAYSFGKDLTGPRLRLEYQLTDNFTLTGAVQYDKDRGTQYLVGARFSIGGAKSNHNNSIYNRLTDKVVRDVDVVTQVSEIDMTKVESNRIWFVDGDDANAEHEGDGTLDHPYSYLDDAVEAAPEGAIIFVKGRKSGDIDHLIRDVMTMKQGQLLWGGSESLYWDFANNKPVTAATSGALLIQAGLGERQKIGGGIIAADNTGIYNFDIIADDNGTQDDRVGITVSNAKNVTIGNTTISGFTAGDTANPFSAIKVSGDNSSVTFNDVHLNNNDIGVDLSSGYASFNVLTIDNSTLFGIYQSGGVLNAHDISITRTGRLGLYQGHGSLNANSISIDGSLNNGLTQHGASINVSQGISITNSGRNGLEASGEINADYLTVDGSTGSGIIHHQGNITTNNISISNTGKAGIVNADGNIFATSIHLDKTKSDALDLIRGKINVDTLDIDHADDMGVLVYYGELNAGTTSITNAAATAFANIQGTSVLGDLTITNADKVGLNIEGGSVHANTITINTSGSNAIQQTAGTLTAEAINIEKAGLDGINQTGGELHANSLTIMDSYSNAVFTNNALLNITGLSTLSGSGQYGLFAEASTVTMADITANNNAETGIVLNNLTLPANFGHIISNDNGKTGFISYSTDFNADSITANKNATNGVELHGAKNKNTIAINSLSLSENTEVGLASYSNDLTLGSIDSQKNQLGVLNNAGTLKIYGGQISNNTATGLKSASGSVILANVTIDANAENGLLIESSNGFINLSDSTLSNNGLHALELNDGATALVSDSIFERNGLASLTGATQLNDLNAAILITDGTLTAHNIIVRDNAAGIEVNAGKLSINENSMEAELRSTIEGNTGYGIWGHQIDNQDQTKPDITIHNTDILNTKAINEKTLSGHGIFAEDINQMQLYDVAIKNNVGTGLWIESGEVKGDLVELDGNGSLVINADAPSADDLTYGLRIDEKTGTNTDVNLNHVTIRNSNIGLLINGGEVSLPNAIIDDID